MNFAQMLASIPKQVREQPIALKEASIRLMEEHIDEYRKGFAKCNNVSTSFVISKLIGRQRVTVGKWLKRYEGKYVKKIGVESYYAGRPRFIWEWVEK